MPTRRTATLATLLALALSAALAGPALAVPVTIPGAPLTIWVDELGQLQAKRDTQQRNIFYRSTSTTGDAGFFLAFPDAAPDELTGKVYGFEGAAGPGGLEGYEAGTQSAATGSGSAADPLKQVTTYAVSPAGVHFAEITQTTTYVNGAQQFGVRWDVKNTSANPLKLKALAAADFYFDGSDRGTGIYTEGPPRFIGGTNADTGNSGGFAEVTGGTSTVAAVVEVRSAPVGLPGHRRLAEGRERGGQRGSDLRQQRRRRAGRQRRRRRVGRRVDPRPARYGASS